MSHNQPNPIRMPASRPFRHHAATSARRSRKRRLISLFVYAGAAFWCALAASVATGSGAVAAASTTSTQTFSAPGTFNLTVPTNASQVQIDGVGAAGTGGARGSLGNGGAAGSGTDVSETLPIAPGAHILPGDNLTVVVGRQGGGGEGSSGGVLGGMGGNGGGATELISPSGGPLLVASGGGGGGGGAGVIANDGGAGGTFSNGLPTYVAGSIAARGGAAGIECGPSGQLVTQGGFGEAVVTGSGGGGGGGGQGVCGGQGGGSGDHGAGKYVDGAGGGGGGSGTNFYFSDATSLSVSGSSNTGHGSLTVTFTLAAPASATLSASTISFPKDQAVATASQTLYVSLTNNGDLPLTFGGLTTAGADAGDFTGDPGTCGAAIAPHSSCQFGASFTPTASGDRSAILVLADNAADSPQEIILTGHATNPPAPASATPSASNLMFGGQEIGTTSTTKQLTLTNNGDLSLTFNGVSVSGPNTADYSADASNCMGGGAPGWDLLEGAPTFTIGAHSSCVINVKFSPHGPRMRNATLVVSDSAADNPQQVHLTGTGLMPPDAVPQETDIAFGAQQLGTSSQAQYVTLENKGDVPLTITGLAATGVDAGDFTGDLGTCGPAVPAHKTCELGASFRPTASGERSATLLISDDAPGSPQQITLTGGGIPAPAGPQGITTPAPPVTVTAPSAHSTHSATPVTTTTTAKKGAPQAMCVVPRLRRMTLSQARRALSHAHCGLGTVRRPVHRRSHHALHVGRQSTAAGARKHTGYLVSIWLIG